MAAPASKTMKSLQGKWLMEKNYSDSTEPIFALQGVGWLTRKAISSASITQHIHTSTTPEGTDHIKIDQFITGGLKGTTENRTLDFNYRPHSDWLFGDVRGRSRWVTIAKFLEDNASVSDEIKEDLKFLTEGWLPESAEGDVVESYVENESKGWTAWQIWGFAEVDVNGEKQRRHVRRAVVRKGKEVVRVRLVYSYLGELEG